MWKWLFSPFTGAYNLMKAGFVEAAGAKASAEAAQNGLKGVAKSTWTKGAKNLAAAKVDKWTGSVLVGTFGVVGLIGGYLGLSTFIGTSQTTAAVASWLGATADEIKTGTGKKLEDATNIVMGVTIIGALTAIASATYIVIKRK